MKMTLHSILHQKGECHGLSKPQAQNGDSVEKVATKIHLDQILLWDTSDYEIFMDLRRHIEVPWVKISE
jgi:hypothetical protein